MSSASISKRSSRRPIRDWPAWRGGEFLLQCRDIEHLGSQGQAGLDLDVYHLASDSVRDVRTLSGGESFMASLAMALGLSDIVQNTAGAVSIDTMFVDEGFGALDDEAREQAVRGAGRSGRRAEAGGDHFPCQRTKRTDRPEAGSKKDRNRQYCTLGMVEKEWERMKKYDYLIVGAGLFGAVFRL